MRLNTDTSLVGTSIRDLCKLARISDDEADKLVKAGHLVMTNRKAMFINGATAYKRRKRSFRHLIAPMQDGIGNCVGVMAFQQDISELIEAQNILREADRIKSDFMANMSHEIRTPIHAILGMSSLAIRMDCAQSKQRDYFEKINRAAEGLLEIVNDILDFSKIGAGKLAIENASFCIRQLAQDLLFIFDDKFEAKGLGFSITIPDSLPSPLLGDNLRIRQILTNLIGNALKFTERGAVCVDCLWFVPAMHGFFSANKCQKVTIRDIFSQ